VGERLGRLVALAVPPGQVQGLTLSVYLRMGEKGGYKGAGRDPGRPVWGWTRRLAREVILTHFARKGPRRGGAPVASSENVVHRALPMLRPKELEAFLMSEGEGMSVREISCELDVPEHVVAARLTRAGEAIVSLTASMDASMAPEVAR
jgi:DNA-directed RNA polymerase specialized sigma24 family protein